MLLTWEYSAVHGRCRTGGINNTSLRVRKARAVVQYQIGLARAACHGCGRAVWREHVKGVGDDVRSHTVTRAVPFALVSLTTGFEMGPGGPSPLLSPTLFARSRPDRSRAGRTSLLSCIPLHRHFFTLGRSTLPSQKHPLPRRTRQNPRPLVRVRSRHCCPSTSRLSSSSSSSGLVQAIPGLGISS